MLIKPLPDDKILRYSDPENRIFNRVFSDISVVLMETTLTISESIDTGSVIEIEIVRVVSLSATEVTEITRFKEKIKHTHKKKI